MKTYIKIFAYGIGLLLLGIGGGVLLTLGSLLISQPISSSDACGVVACRNGAATVAVWRGFPFGITESSVAPFQNCDVIDCYSYYHTDAAIADVCVWAFVSYTIMAFVAVGIIKGERMDSNDNDYVATSGKANNV